MTSSGYCSGYRNSRSMGWKIRAAISGIVLILLVSTGGPVFAAEEPDLTAEPRRLIAETADRIVSVLGREDVSAEVRIQEIEKIAYDIFDFTTMSKLVLARKWRKLSKDQKGEFVREFKRSLSRTYGTRLDRYEQEKVEIYGTQIEPRDDVSVKTRIVGGEYDGAELSYRLRKRSDRWRIIDVVIEGVSLVSNYRSQFAEILNTGTIDDLLEKLRDKNFKVQDGASRLRKNPSRRDARASRVHSSLRKLAVVNHSFTSAPRLATRVTHLARSGVFPQPARIRRRPKGPSDLYPRNVQGENQS